ncbi:tRNA 2-selenouridine(34) synthase MnmH [Paracoccus aminophilus]|uniref:tRNA 2-selenouridine synthase n=1 Tax=Paracoccus aminophilus JCM 7686 TaxID=1367847 RepID=S5Y1W9_PARAH|nr:tRNA 2-selenouridine(34) synthase MnmH [Paracoccus aminophilus]AGT09725.1 tRNA 2-selenouridine synthase [Paracoccus aminophilus JCM 7686]
MTLKLQQVLDPALAGFDTIIDVRAPSEYAEDHLPGAINLPVLNDQERAQVGTIYKQISPFDARKLGGALVAANAARHITESLADKPGSWRPLVYCWRGGQRSGSFATILSQIGWRVAKIEGGYKSWRGLVVDRVQNGPLPSPVIVLDGNTGSAKTEILHILAARGHQVIDLEGLAHHRGSLFGGRAEGQPSQKMFEGRLALAMEALDPTRPVLFEAESSKVGDLTVPRAIWKALIAAPRLRLVVPVAERARYTARAYADMTADPQQIAAILERLRAVQSGERIAAWQALALAGEWQKLSEGLMRDHYDPRYDSHRARHDDGRGGQVMLDDLRDLDAAASRVEAALARLA